MNRFLLIKSNPKLIKSQKRFLHKRFFYENLKTLKNRNIGYEFDIDGNEFNHIKSSRYICLYLIENMIFQFILISFICKKSKARRRY